MPGAKIRCRRLIFELKTHSCSFALGHIAAQARGINVRVMLNPSRRDGEEDNAETRALLIAGGVTVKDSNPAFGLTHEKSMVVDGRIAMIKSLNWATRNLTETRDYAIITDHANEVHEVSDCFDAD